MAKHVTAVRVADVQKRRAPSKHYVYVIQVTWSDGSVLTIYRRYSAFFDFHASILEAFPVEGSDADDGKHRIIPYLPGKKLFGRSHTYRVAQSRCNLLDVYLKAMIQLPEKISRSQLVLDFLEAKKDDIRPPTQDERERKSQGMVAKLLGGDQSEEPVHDPQIGDVMVLERYRAVADYTQRNRNELTFKTGDEFEVIEKKDNGWWFVSSDDERQGWVPATYLESVDGPEEEAHQESGDAGGKYITVAKYKATQDDEVGYEKGVVLTVIEKSLDGWWKVVYQGKTGWTPAVHLEKISDEAPAEAAVAAPPVQMRQKNTLDVQAPPPRRESISRPVSIHGLKGKFAFAAGSDEAKPAAAAEPPKPARAAPAPEQPAAVAKAQAQPVVAKAQPAPVAKATPAPTPAPAPAPAPTPAPAAEKQKAPSPEKPKAADKVYFTVEAFRKLDDSGISFAKGQRVSVIEQTNTGWWYVDIDGEEGWAPADYIMEKSELEAAAKAKAKTATAATAAATPAAAAAAPAPVAESKPAVKTAIVPPAAAAKPEPAAAATPAKPEPVAKPRAGSSTNPVAPSPTAATPTPAAKPSPVAAAKPPAAAATAATATGSPTPAAKPAAAPAPVAAAKPAATPAPAAAAKPTPTPAAKAQPQPQPQPVAAKKPAPVAAPAAAEGDIYSAPSQVYIALADYKALSDTEATLVLGETITVEERNEGWWFVRTQSGKSGWAPSDYLALQNSAAANAAAAKSKAPVAAPRAKPTRAIARSAYAAQTPEEASLKAREQVDVLEKADNGWWFVRVGTKEGWAPADYLRETGVALVVNASCLGAYKGAVARAVCEKAIVNSPSGTWMVRDSETTPGNYSITMKIQTQIHHFKVTKSGDQLVVADRPFADLEDIVDFFTTTAIYTSAEGETFVLGEPFTASIKA
eukprot:m.66658 g.66658  ORF g.66658 m.66658 type:complete len:917 (-) comp14059_c0_seq1:167-2917(-)